MAPKKAQAKSKSKAPVKRARKEISPPRAASVDDEVGPVLDELRSKLEALEKRQHAGQPGTVLGRHARVVEANDKECKKARLLAMANDILSRLSTLEDDSADSSEPPDYTEAVPEEGTGFEGSTQGASKGHYQTQRGSRSQSTSTAAAVSGNQELPSHMSGELAAAPGTSNISWPWGMGGLAPSVQGLHNASFPALAPSVQGLHNAGYGDWGLPYLQASYPPSGLGSPGAGTWPFLAPPTAGFHTVPSKAKPCGDVGSELGSHLSPITRMKILQGAYLDMFSLLNTEDHRVKETEDEDDKQRRLRKKPEHTWENWLSGYTIYMGVIVAAQPWRAWSLVQYQDLIHRAHADFPGDTWLQYDQGFRKRAALNPTLRWDEPLSKLWLQTMTPARPMAGDRFDSGHLIRRPYQQNKPHAVTGQVVLPRFICWDYNGPTGCKWKSCKFTHECSICGGKHPNVSCFRARGQRGAGGKDAAGANKRQPPASTDPKRT